MSISLRHKAHETIKNRIISLEFKPGDALRESDIAKELGMGRTPVREALLMLEHEKLVVCRANVGYFVKKLTHKEAGDYFALRETLELFSASFIIERITVEKIAEMEEVLADSVVCMEKRDIRGNAQCNSKFHEMLYKATDSDAFIELISHLMDKIMWLLAIAIQSDPSEALVDHRRIVEAIRRRDIQDLRKEIQVHLEHARSRYLSISEMFF